MKKIEFFLGCMFILGNLLKLWNIPGWLVIVKLSSILLCFIYFFFSYVLLNPMRIEDSKTYSVGVYRTIVSILIGWALSTFVVGVYAVVSFWLEGWFFSIIGLTWLIVCCAILLFGKQRYKEFVTRCFKHIIIVICIGGIAIIETMLLAA